MQVEECHVTLADGTQVWTATSGPGRPMVFLHGGSGLWDYLEPLAALPHATRIAVAGAGHAPWADLPDETRDLILRAIGARAPAG